MSEDHSSVMELAREAFVKFIEASYNFHVEICQDGTGLLKVFLKNHCPCTADKKALYPHFLRQLAVIVFNDHQMFLHSFLVLIEHACWINGEILTNDEGEVVYKFKEEAIRGVVDDFKGFINVQRLPVAYSVRSLR